MIKTSQVMSADNFGRMLSYDLDEFYSAGGVSMHPIHHPRETRNYQRSIRPMFIFPHDSYHLPWGDGCSSHSASAFEGDLNHDHTYALVVARGNCSFEDKARHAMEAGAGALIVVDDEKPDDDRPLMPMRANSNEGIDSLLAVMVTHETGTNLFNVLKQGRERHDHVVTVQLSRSPLRTQWMPLFSRWRDLVEVERQILLAQSKRNNKQNDDVVSVSLSDISGTSNDGNTGTDTRTTVVAELTRLEASWNVLAAEIFFPLLNAYYAFICSTCTIHEGAGSVPPTYHGTTLNQQTRT